MCCILNVDYNFNDNVLTLLINIIEPLKQALTQRSPV